MGTAFYKSGITTGSARGCPPLGAGKMYLAFFAPAARKMPGTSNFGGNSFRKSMHSGRAAGPDFNEIRGCTQPVCISSELH